ncbi:hypothetical protein [Actinomyces oris]|uniref:hypothetical protein n=1 Tax=Actinomyces oris TaxID=544580 RepID=UPI000C782388|nr:hypothetical protein [Actinomyces oris]PKY82041.1 hypothetical protein CYJ24_12915 [Actinomyces naeslundii]
MFDHVTNAGGGWCCAYDVTALYFEAEREDELRKVGCSKVRRVDPQAILGARQVRALGDLGAHFHWEGDAFTDG